ncbi:MAG: hypothetical protein AAF601_02500 [Pseudomonadota bacterium]
MVHDAWHVRHKAVEDQHEAARIEIKALEKKIARVVDRLISSDSAVVIAVCEREIEKLERKKIVLEEQTASTKLQKQAPAEFIELVLEFLANRCIIWRISG